MSVLRDLFWVVVSCICHLVYRVVGITLQFLQHFTIPRSDHYINSCQLMRIIWRRKLFMIDVVTPQDFLGVHEALVHPNYVLKPNVSLYCVSRKEAIFVETPDSVDIYSSKVSPFQYIGQFRHASKLIRMPISSFHTLADSVDKPRVPVGYLANTGRCGSTILAQALETVPGMLVHAEPDCLTNICILKKDKTITHEEWERLLFSSIQLLCKPLDGVSVICIKTRSCASSNLLTLAKIFPKMKLMFGYRGARATVSSFLGLMISGTVQSLSLYVINSDMLSKVVPYYRRMLHFYFVLALDRDQPLVTCENMNAVEMFAYMWALCMNLARDLKHQREDLLPILYEDILADAWTECKKVFDILHIDHKHLDAAMMVFKKDSQENSPLSRTITQDDSRRSLSTENVLRADKILFRFGLPGLQQNYRL